MSDLDDNNLIANEEDIIEEGEDILDENKCNEELSDNNSVCNKKDELEDILDESKCDEVISDNKKDELEDILDRTIEETIEEENYSIMINKFNKIYKNFINYISKTYNIQENKNNNYYDHFIINILPHMDEISVNNIDYFWYSNDNIELIPGLKYKKIIKKLELKKKNTKYDLDKVKKINTYLMTLYLILFNQDKKGTYILKYVNTNLKKKENVDYKKIKESII